MKYSATRMGYRNDGIKNVDVFFKIITLPCSWQRQIVDSSFYQSKIIITLLFIYETFGDHFKFHSNIDFNDDTVKFFLSFYKSMFRNWNFFFNVNPSVPSCILNQILRIYSN